MTGDGRARWLALGLAALLPSCLWAHAASTQPGMAWLGVPIELGEGDDGARTEQVVLITLDGVRWQEIFDGVDPALAREAGLAAEEIVKARGLLPQMHRRFFDEGVVIGAPQKAGGIFASGPNYVSLPGYLEILRGRTSPDCQSNDCPPFRGRTLLDEVRSLPRTTHSDAAAFTSWHELSRAAAGDPGRVVVSTGRVRGSVSELAWLSPRCDLLLERGRLLPPAPGTSEYRPDHATAELALCYLTSARPKFLWAGFGDTDELAHQKDYGGYLKALRAADSFVGAIFEELGKMGEYGRTTTVIVTTDHGRGPGFPDHGPDAAASRVFLLAAGGKVPPRGTIATERPHRLADIAPTIRVLLGIPSGTKR